MNSGPGWKNSPVELTDPEVRAVVEPEHDVRRTRRMLDQADRRSGRLAAGRRDTGGWRRGSGVTEDDGVVIGTGLVADAQAATNRPAIIVVAIRDGEERIPSPPDGLSVRRSAMLVVTWTHSLPGRSRASLLAVRATSCTGSK